MLHCTSKQQGQACSPRRLPSVPSASTSISLLPCIIILIVLWAASEVAVSNVHPGVLAAGEGECCVTPERKAVWEVCIVVCLSARLSPLLLGEVDPVFEPRHALEQLRVIEVHVVGKVCTNR